MLTITHLGVADDVVDAAADAACKKAKLSPENCANFLAAAKTGDAEKIAAVLAAAGATAACAPAGPLAYLCGGAAAAVVGWLFDQGCEGGGGVIWCTREYDGKGTWQEESNWKRIDPPEQLKQRSNFYKRSLCAGTAAGPSGTPGKAPAGCCTKTYCQKPGMPKPSSLADLRDKLSRPAMKTTPLLVKDTSIRVWVPFTYTAFDPKIQKWRIAMSKADRERLATTPTGFGEGLTPTADDKLVEVAQSPTKPTGANVVVLTVEEYKRLATPWYKKWWFWAAVGGTALVAAGTTTYFVRRKSAG